MTGQTLVIGIGNADRGDDGVGLEVARLVAKKAHNVRVIELDYPSDALNAWTPEDTVVITDAVNSGAEPGTLHVVDVVAHRLPAGNWSAGGSHALGLAAVVELARALDKLPRKLVVVGVEARQFTFGTSMSEVVTAAVPAAAVAVIAAVGGRKQKRKGASK
jgi:hydrogenase maturation protease